MKSFTIFRLPLLLLFVFVFILFGCEQEKILLPKEETVYLYPYRSKVDAKHLSCGYKTHEYVNDKTKREMRRQVGTLSNQQLTELGQEVHESVKPLLIGHSKYKLAKTVTRKLKRHMSNNAFSNDVYVVSDTTFNAFTIPGGNIYLTSRLMDEIENPHQLAYIIGHELGHNENNHTKESAIAYYYLKQMQQKSVLKHLSALGTTLAKKISNKSDELECDISAIYLLTQAGYDPELALGGIELLKKISSPKPNKKWKEYLQNLVRTHPWSEDREQCLTSYVRDAKVKVGCDSIYNLEVGIVNTKHTPLGIYQYPSKLSNRKYDLPRGVELSIICDAIRPTTRSNRDWFYVAYKYKSEKITGWVDQKYIKLKHQ